MLFAHEYVSRRVAKAWSTLIEASDGDASPISVKESIKAGYEDVEKTVAFELFNECLVVAILLARKFVLQSCIGMGVDFDPASLSGEEQSMRRFWRVIDACSSLRSSGWAGEAGAMAIAAEALGLGISSNEQIHHKSLGDRSGLVPSSDLDDGLILPVAGSHLLIDTVIVVDSPIRRLLASAEVALGSGGGGCVTSLLQESLQSAVSLSSEFREILVAAVRRSVRLLAVVEYDGDDANKSSEVSRGSRSFLLQSM